MHLTRVGPLWLRRYAVLVACCTFGLVIAGGLVTSNDAALSVPDWPLSWGHLVPALEGGIRYEFAHRVTAMLVGLLTVGLAVGIHRQAKACPTMKWWGGLQLANLAELDSTGTRLAWARRDCRLRAGGARWSGSSLSDAGLGHHRARLAGTTLLRDPGGDLCRAVRRLPGTLGCPYLNMYGRPLRADHPGRRRALRSGGARGCTLRAR